jgi:hypothetical protein
MATTLRFTDADRDPDGKLLTLDQLLASSRQAIAGPRQAADDVPDPQALPPPHGQARSWLAGSARPTPALIAAVLVVLLLLGGVALWFGRVRAPMMTPTTDRRPPTAAPAATIVPHPIAQFLAFAAPDGAALGTIEATRAITPTAHYGERWIQADVAGSGRVWLRSADWPGLPIVGPDLTPRKATAAPAVVAPPPTPEPQPPCLTAGTGNQTVTVCDWGDLEAEAKAKWIATYGGNTGVVTTPTPQEWNKP